MTLLELLFPLALFFGQLIFFIVFISFFLFLFGISRTKRSEGDQLWVDLVIAASAN